MAAAGTKPTIQAKRSPAVWFAVLRAEASSLAAIGITIAVCIAAGIATAATATAAAGTTTT
jgi:hypothetical protein